MFVAARSGRADIGDPAEPVVTAKLRLGSAIQDESNGVLGGASPSGVIADGQHVYVTLAHEDSVAVIEPDGRAVQSEIALTPFSGADSQDGKGRPLRGVMPMGLAQDAKRLYVTEAGVNAVAVIDKESSACWGTSTTGWYPAAVALSPDQRTLYIVNNKGKGAGPNGGKAFQPNGSAGCTLANWS